MSSTNSINLIKWIKKKSKTLKKINDQSGKMMFVIIIKKYPLNIFKMSQWSYLIKKKYILNENEIIS